jgi:hypothetical protein
MKKIYLLTLGLVAFVVTSRSQDICGGRTPTGVTSPWSGFCVAQLINLPPSLPGQPPVQVKLYAGSGGVGFIPTISGADVFSDANGHAEYVYSCSFTPTWLEACNVNGCCPGNVVAGGPLPVKLTSFTGRLQNDNQVTLDWSSALEFENSKYEVERSADGKYFEKVGTLTGAGSTSNISRYTFNDRLPGSGAYFYRLKQIDFDGIFEYSKVVYVNSKKGAGVITKIFPNPFKGEVQLIGATSSDLTPNNVQVFNVAGQRVTYRFMGANSILIDPSAPDGIYMLKVKGDTYKLVKNQASGTGY